MNLDAGGAQTFVASLAIEQTKQGHEVSIIIIDKLVNSNFQKLLIGSLNQHGVDLHLLNRRVGRNITIVNTIKGIIQTLSLGEPDIINTHIPTAHLLVKLCLNFVLSKLKNRQVITVHNAPENWSWLNFRFNSHTPTIYCSFSALQINRQRACLKIAIQNGIPSIRTNYVTKQSYQFGNKDSRRVLCVGRLSSQKNYDLICEIAKHFEGNGVDFLICGLKLGTAARDLANFSKTSNIYYLGIQTQEEIYSLMEHCDCFLNASLYEGLPITVLEAFFSGIPCVLSRIPPHIEIGTDMPFCFMGELNSGGTFVNKIEIALNYTGSKEEIINLRQPFLNNYSINTTASKYETFYNKVIAS